MAVCLPVASNGLLIYLKVARSRPISLLQEEFRASVVEIDRLGEKGAAGSGLDIRRSGIGLGEREPGCETL